MVICIAYKYTLVRTWRTLYTRVVLKLMSVLEITIMNFSLIIIVQVQDVQCIQLVKYKNHRFLPFCYFPLQIERK